MQEQFHSVVTEYEQLSEKLASLKDAGDFKKYGKRHSQLEPTVAKIRALVRLEEELRSTKELAGSPEADISQLAQKDLPGLQHQVQLLTAEIEENLLPRDPLDEKDVIMEIRAAAGGDEAALFAAELYRMYVKFSEFRGWRPALISQSRNELGGFKEIILEIHGHTVYGNLRFESGVHRVQRVPATEKSGRVHTSTVTVAVLPLVEETDFKIEPKDLKIETSTSRGAGGQSVNTTYSAIKITHLPTGITAQSQDERSQIQNRAKALQVLTARVFAFYEEQRLKELTQTRRAQIGSGDRSEKVRTYNFPQDRITDHRLGASFKQITLILEGKLDPIIFALQETQKSLLRHGT